MRFPIPKDCPLPRPNWAWISPAGDTFQIGAAYKQSHEQWVTENLYGTEEYVELSDGSVDLEGMFSAGWIRRSGEIFQTTRENAEKAKGYIDRHEAHGKHFTIVARFDDGAYYGLGTMPGVAIDATGGWTKINGV